MVRHSLFLGDGTTIGFCCDVVCLQPRNVRLFPNFQEWEIILRQTWQDLVLPGQPLSITVISPRPSSAPPEVAAHVLLVQRPQEELCSSLLTVYDQQSDVDQPNRQLVYTITEHVFLEQLIHGLGLTAQCLLAGGTLHCRAWHGEWPLTLGILFRG